MLQRLLPALSSRVPASRLLSVAQTPYSTQPSTDEIGPGPGSRSRSINQAKAAGETSNTSGPESAPARSPDAPADPADLAKNRGSDPQEVLRSSSWQAQQAMSSSSYEDDNDPEGSGVMAGGAPQAAGRFAEKVSNAANIAAQAVTGAASAMSDTVKAATGAASSGAAHGRAQEVSLSDSPDASPVSDDNIEFGNQVPETNSDTAASGEIDSASGTADPDMLSRKAGQGKYQEAAERLMDMEGLPKKAA